jgi:hypothetical protein
MYVIEGVLLGVAFALLPFNMLTAVEVFALVGLIHWLRRERA